MLQIRDFSKMMGFFLAQKFFIEIIIYGTVIFRQIA